MATAGDATVAGRYKALPTKKRCAERVMLAPGKHHGSAKPRLMPSRLGRSVEAIQWFSIIGALLRSIGEPCAALQAKEIKCR